MSNTMSAVLLNRLLPTLLVLIIFSSATGQTSEKTKYSLASDISPLVYNGYSLKLGIIPKVYPQTELALEIFSLDIPELIIEANEANANKGWSEIVEPGIALYFDRKIGANQNALWVGGGIVYLNHFVHKQNEKNEFQQLEYLLRVNYKWYPFENKGFYLNPYFAFAYRHKVSGDNGSYDLNPFLVIPSVYLSWEI